ncbi:PREDICTED: rhox homeobox family member 1-like, partial [Galeopterus variegatus]|uniref:Rhox homeobox family member 1-like n=1 Tax=Galeopterus variegatus TaxID=482537 RepID=A0ABM0Q603_GALVR
AHSIPAVELRINSGCSYLGLGVYEVEVRANLESDTAPEAEKGLIGEGAAGLEGNENPEGDVNDEGDLNHEGSNVDQEPRELQREEQAHMAAQGPQHQNTQPRFQRNRFTPFQLQELESVFRDTLYLDLLT